MGATEQKISFVFSASSNRFASCRAKLSYFRVVTAFQLLVTPNYVHRSDHLDSFGHILPATEFLIFALPLAAIFAGFFELMMRERTGLTRPAIGRNWTAQGFR